MAIQQNLTLDPDDLLCLYQQADCETNFDAAEMVSSYAEDHANDPEEPIDPDLISAFLQISECGQKGLGFKQFEILYNRVMKVLKPQLGLSPTETDWLLTQKDIVDELHQKLVENSWSNAAKDKSNEIIDYLIENPERVSPPPIFGKFVSCESFDFDNISVNDNGDLISTSVLAVSLIWVNGQQIVKKIDLALEFRVPWDNDPEFPYKASVAASDAVNWGTDTYWKAFGQNYQQSNESLIQEYILALNFQLWVQQNYTMVVSEGDENNPDIKEITYLNNIISYLWNCNGF